jgi:hypothetical protein
MALEQSHGKRRPTLPRSRALAPVATARDRRAFRDEGGRFGSGNVASRGRGWKRAIIRLLGRDAALADPDANRVAEDAFKIFRESLAELPHDGATVRALVARKARHESLESYWSARALAKLGTPEGVEAEQQATLHGQRAERLCVTAIDVATRLAQARPAPAWPAAWAPPPQDEPAEQEPEPDYETDEPPAEAPSAPGRAPETRVSGRAEPTAPTARCSHQNCEGAGSSACVLCAKLAAHVGGKVDRAMFCSHGANRHSCPICFRSKLEAQPSSVPWRQALPKSHPAYRGPR